MSGARKRDLLPACLFLGPNFLGFCVFVALPVVFSIIMAFTNWDLTLHNRFSDQQIKWVWLQNFKELFTTADFWKYLGNTLFLMMGIPLGIAGSLFLAVMLTRRLRSKSQSTRWALAALSLAGFAALGLWLQISGLGLLALVFCMLAGGVMALGFVTGSVVYRTLFYLPHFTSGVAVYLLWKQMYNPDLTRGPVNAALAAPLANISWQANRISPGWGLAGTWACAALLVLLLVWGISRIRKMWCDGDVGSGMALLAVALLLMPVALSYSWLPRASDGETALITINDQRAVQFTDRTGDGKASSFEVRLGADSQLVKRINAILAQPVVVKEEYDKALAEAAPKWSEDWEKQKQDLSKDKRFAGLSAEELAGRIEEAKGEWLAAREKTLWIKVIETKRKALSVRFSLSFDLKRTSVSGQPDTKGIKAFLIFDPPDPEVGIAPFYGAHRKKRLGLKAAQYDAAGQEWLKINEELAGAPHTFDVLPAYDGENPLTDKPIDPARRAIKDVRIRFMVAAGAKDAGSAETESYAVANLSIAETGASEPALKMDFAAEENPFTQQGRDYGVRWFLVAAAGLVALWGTLKCRRLPEMPAKWSVGLGAAAAIGIFIMVGEFILLGLANVSYSLSEISLDGLMPPKWVNDFHWAKPAIMMMGLWAAIGSNNMLLYIAGISNIPPALYEAAQVDGASGWQRFWNITWPQLAPTTFFIVIMAFIGGLQGGFEVARTMTGGGPFGATTTLTYYVYQQGFESLRFGYASAVAWVMFAMIFALTIFNYKFGSRYINE